MQLMLIGSPTNSEKFDVWDYRLMQDIWQRIENWLQNQAPHFLDTLATGASEAEIQALETALKIHLPEDVKSSYRIHNGQIGDGSGLIDNEALLSIERIQEEWMAWQELLDSGTFNDENGEEIRREPNLGIKDVWWSERWVPITYDGCGNHICLDLDPAEGGAVGQMIRMWHDDPVTELLAPSFRVWLEQYAEGLAANRFTYREEYGGIVDVNYL